MAAPPMYFPVPTVPVRPSHLMQRPLRASPTEQQPPQQASGTGQPHATPTQPSHHSSQPSPHSYYSAPYMHGQAYSYHPYPYQQHYPSPHQGYYASPAPPRPRTLSAQQLAEIQSRQARFQQRKADAEQKAVRSRTESTPSVPPPPVPLATRPRGPPPLQKWPTPESGPDGTHLVPPSPQRAPSPKVAVDARHQHNVLMDGSRLQRLAQANAGPPAIPPIPLPDVSRLALSTSKAASVSSTSSSSLAPDSSISVRRASSPFEDHGDDDYEEPKLGPLFAFNPFTPVSSTEGNERSTPPGLSQSHSPSQGSVLAAELQKAAKGFAIFPSLPVDKPQPSTVGSGPSIWNEHEQSDAPPTPVSPVAHFLREEESVEDEPKDVTNTPSGGFVLSDWADDVSSSDDDTSSVLSSDDEHQDLRVQSRPIYGPPVVCLGTSTKNILAEAPITPPNRPTPSPVSSRQEPSSPLPAIAERRAAMRRAAAEREQAEARRLRTARSLVPSSVGPVQPPRKLSGWASVAAAGLRITPSPAGGDGSRPITPTTPITRTAIVRHASSEDGTPALSPVVIRADGMSSTDEDGPSEPDTNRDYGSTLAADAFNALGLSFEIGGSSIDDGEEAIKRASTGKQRMNSVDSTASSSSGGSWEEVKRAKPSSSRNAGQKVSSRFGAIGQRAAAAVAKATSASATQQKLQPAIQRRPSVPPIVWQEGEQVFRDLGQIERKIVKVVGFSKLPTCKELARVFFEPRDKVFRRLPQPASITAATVPASSPWTRGFQTSFVVLLFFDGELEASRLEQIAPRGVTFDQAARLTYARVESSHAWPKDAEWMDRPSQEGQYSDDDDADRGRLPATKAMHRPKLSRPVAHGRSAIPTRRHANVQHVRTASQERRRRAAIEEDRERFRIARNEEITVAGRAIRMKHGKGSKAPFGASFGGDVTTAARKKDAAKARLHGGRR